MAVVAVAVAVAGGRGFSVMFRSGWGSCRHRFLRSAIRVGRG
jgi:hypothetical protein